MSEARFKTATVHGSTVNYVEAGEGPVLPPIHGMPQVEAPGRFIAAIQRFLRETEPAEFDRDEWRARFQAA